ncbi:hypothetical protein EXIGLDRAFT_737195, partial [Exidia glandulosa HHB12029]
MGHNAGEAPHRKTSSIAAALARTSKLRKANMDPPAKISAAFFLYTMVDTLRTDSAQQRAVPNAFSKLMESPCGGHALLNPRKTSAGGGQLGDGGYISQGKFIQEFNVYRMSRSVPEPLKQWRRARIEDELYPYSMPLVSSRQTEIDLEIGLSGDTMSMLAPPVQVNPKITLKDAEFASLVAYEPTLQDYMKREEIDAVRNWLIDNRHRVRKGTVVLTGVVRASGWVALYSSVHQQSASLVVGLATTVIGAFGSGSYAFADAKKILSRGPANWGAETRAADYTVIINYVRVLSRLERLLQKGKIQVSNAGTESAPDELDQQTPNTTPSCTGPENPSSASSYTPSPTPTSTTGHSSFSTIAEDCDMDLLTCFLDIVLDQRGDLDFVAADTGIIVDFIHRYQRVPELSHVAIVIDVSERDAHPQGATTGEIGATEAATDRIGCISRLEAHNDDGPVVVNRIADVVISGSAAFGRRRATSPSPRLEHFHGGTPFRSSSIDEHKVDYSFPADLASQQMAALPTLAQTSAPDGPWFSKLADLCTTRGRSLKDLNWNDKLIGGVWHSDVK